MNSDSLLRGIGALVLAAAVFLVAYLAFDLFFGSSLALFGAALVGIVAGASFVWAFR